MPGPVARELQQPDSLLELKRRVLKDTSLPAREVGEGRDLAREGDPSVHCLLLLDGFACSYKLMRDGRRQISALHLPNDLCSLPSLLLGHLGYSVGTLTPARVVFVPHVTIFDWMDHHPDRIKALWQATLVDAAISQEWLVNIGRRMAYQRTAHLLCEFLVRMRRAGLAEGLTCRMPFTQAELADTLGLTGVHINRTLQWLRNENLIDIRNGTLIVHNWPELTLVAEFNPAYLYQTGTAN